MPPMTDVLDTLRASIDELREAVRIPFYDVADTKAVCSIVANSLALLHDSLEADHKRSVAALVAEDRLEEMRADALRNGSFYDQATEPEWEAGL